MPSLSRKWVIAAAVVIGLAVIGGIVKALLPSEENRLETLRVVEVTRSPFYAPQYVALSKGFFEEEGLDIQLSNGFGGDKTMTALLSGDADIVLVGVEAAVYVNARGASSPVTAFAQLTQTDGSFLVSREPMENFRWSDLRGKALLGQRKGGMPQMVSEYVQRKNGLNPHKDVKIIQNVDYKTWEAPLPPARAILRNCLSRPLPCWRRKEKDMSSPPSASTAENFPTPPTSPGPNSSKSARK